MIAAALDIGGAHIKAARSDGHAASHRFSLWKEPDSLPEVLGRVAGTLLPFETLAVTMTGELCDCYENRADGVRHILASVERVAREVAPEAKILVWRLDGRLVSIPGALEAPSLVGAANWLALAAWAAAVAAEAAVLVDVGSTTTDIVPLLEGRPRPAALSDVERLQRGELVYSGVSRTPVCAIARQLPFRGVMTRVAAEFFATTRDVYLTLGDLDEDPGDRETADGRPAARRYARARLARTICCDPEDFDDADAGSVAAGVAREQLHDLTAAIETVLRAADMRPKVAVISGAGEFLARRVAAAAGVPEVLAVSERHGTAASQAACAFALSALACATAAEPDRSSRSGGTGATWRLRR